MLGAMCQLIKVEAETLLACLFGSCGLSRFFGVACAPSFVKGMCDTRGKCSRILFCSTSLQATMLGQNPIECEIGGGNDSGW